MNIYEKFEFKYAPSKFDDLILNEKIKQNLRKVIETVPNTILVSTPGLGKGSFAIVLLNETKFDYIWLNGSDENSIDIMRKKVKTFSEALGRTDIKLVIINEADRLSPESQRMLLEQIEKVQKFTRFFFMANNINRLDDALKSRLNIVEISNPPAKEIFNRCKYILESEKIKFNKESLVSLVKDLYPDIRQIIITMQSNIHNNEFSSYVLPKHLYEEIVTNLCSNDMYTSLESIRSILRSNKLDYNQLYTHIFDNITKLKNPVNAILTIGEAIRWHNIVALPEINAMTCFMKLLKGD